MRRMKPLAMFFLIMAMLLQTMVPAAAIQNDWTVEPGTSFSPLSESVQAVGIDSLAKEFNVARADIVKWLNNGYSLSEIYQTLQQQKSSNRMAASETQESVDLNVSRVTTEPAQLEAGTVTGAVYYNLDSTLQNLTNPDDLLIVAERLDQEYERQPFEQYEELKEKVAIRINELRSGSVTTDTYQPDARLEATTENSIEPLMTIQSQNLPPLSYGSGIDTNAIAGLSKAKQTTLYDHYQLNESVSPIDGSLSVSATDLVLPGTNGLSFALQRSYNSNRSDYYEKKTISGLLEDVEYFLYVNPRLYYQGTKTVPTGAFFQNRHVMNSSGVTVFYRTEMRWPTTQGLWEEDRDYNSYFYRGQDFANLKANKLKIQFPLQDPNDPNAVPLETQFYFPFNTLLSLETYTTGTIGNWVNSSLHGYGVWAYGNTTAAKPAQPQSLAQGWLWEIPYIEYKNGKNMLYLPSQGSYELSGTNIVGYHWKDLKLELFPPRYVECPYDPEDYSCIEEYGDEIVRVNGKLTYYKLTNLEGNEYHFTQSGQLLQIRDPFKNTITFTYDGFGRIARIEDGAANEIAITYSANEITAQLKQGATTYQTITYDLTSDAANTANIKLLSQVSKQVNDVDQQTVSYVYETKGADFNLVTGFNRGLDRGVNYIAALSEVHYPSGAFTKYSYTSLDRQLGAHSYEYAHRVTNRKDGYVAPNQTTVYANEISYSYDNDGASPIMTASGSSTFSFAVHNGRTLTTYAYEQVKTNETTPPVYYNTTIVETGGTTQRETTLTYDRPNHRTKPTKIEVRTLQDSQYSPTDVTEQTFDEYGNVLTHHKPNGQIVTNTYDAAFHLLKSSSAPQNANQSDYTTITRSSTTRAIQAIARQENGESGAELARVEYGYHANGDIAQETVKDDSRDLVTTYTYSDEPDGTRKVTKSTAVTNANQQGSTVVTQYYIHKTTGNLMKVTDANGQTTSYAYDKLGRLLQTQHPGGSSATYTYDDVNNRVTTTDETGVVTIVAWDPLGRKIEEKINGKDAVTYGYDPYSRLSWTKQGNLPTTAYTYDLFDRVLTVTSPGQKTSTKAYNDEERYALSTDANGNKTYTYVDNMGQVIKQEMWNASDVSKSLVEQEYDWGGRVTKVTEGSESGGDAQTTQYTYDPLNRLKTVVNARSETTAYRYSKAGFLFETTYANNEKTSYAYDELGRRIKKTNPAHLVETYFYDGNGNLVSYLDRNGNTRSYQYNVRNWLVQDATADEVIGYTYDLAGRRLTMADGTGTTHYSYEAASGWLQKITFPDAKELQYAYDASGRRIQMTDPFGKVTHYSYTADNQLQGVGATSGTSDVSYSYYDNGLMNVTVFANTVTHKHTYDEYNLTAVSIRKSGVEQQRMDYGYSRHRNMTSKTEGGQAHSYTYDKLDRIETNTQYNEQYSYDAVGNRISLTSNKPFQFASASYMYDQRNRLTQVSTGSATVGYKYNGDGLLVERTEGGITTRYYYDQGNVIAEGTVQGGTVTHKASYMRGNRLVARVAPDNTKHYYLHNGHGDVVGLTDSNGNVVNTYAYDIWGSPTVEQETVSNPFRYSGEYWDATTGLQYLRARWYDPSIGRFMNEDTYEGDISNPLSLNLYTYVYNNPLRYIDPTGHFTVAIYGPSDYRFGEKSVVDANQYQYLSDVASGIWGQDEQLKSWGQSQLNQQMYYRNMDYRDQKMEIATFLITEFTPAKIFKLGKTATKAAKALDNVCNCFTAGTKVLTDEGEKPIEEIEVGDKVLAKSDETGEVAYKEVVGLFQKQADEIYYVHIGDEIIEVTGEHPFWLDGKGWTFVKDLKVGDLLISSDGSKLAIEKIGKEPREATVYNFEVADFNSYFVSNLGVWVHNCALQNVYKSIKDAPLYPQGFSGAKNGTVKNKVNNGELLEELREIESGTWNKIYKDGVDANGKKISIHYFQSQSGQVFNVKVKNGWSNSSSQMP